MPFRSDNQDRNKFQTRMTRIDSYYIIGSFTAACDGAQEIWSRVTLSMAIRMEKPYLEPHAYKPTIEEDGCQA